MLLQIESPNPVPCTKSFSFSKRVKICGSFSLDIPQPVSLTYSFSQGPSCFKPKVILPFSVFLIAFDKKLNNTCITRLRSVEVQYSPSGRITFNSTFDFIFSWCTFSTSSTSPAISTCWKCISDLPDSIRERSKISLINCNNKLLFFWIISRYSIFSSSLSVTAIISEKPTIAFNGVRISWLILAKKTDFILSASSARRLASINSCERWIRSPISCINASTLFPSKGAIRAWK